MTPDQVCEYCPLNPRKSPVQRVCWAQRFEANYAREQKSTILANKFDQNSRQFPSDCFVLIDGSRKHFWCHKRRVTTI